MVEPFRKVAVPTGNSITAYPLEVTDCSNVTAISFLDQNNVQSYEDAALADHGN